MSRTIRTRFVWLACLATTMVGCHAANAPLPGEDAPAAAAATPGTKQGAKANRAPTPAVAEQSPAVHAFTPPFPNRVDLFQPPKRAEGTQHRGETNEGLVELKGFVNVDGPRVVLSIDGAIAPLPEGGEKYGVQVISINPPSVVLQRGRSRWTASLD
jgi:hypothetical protein